MRYGAKGPTAFRAALLAGGLLLAGLAGGCRRAEPKPDGGHRASRTAQPTPAARPPATSTEATKAAPSAPRRPPRPGPTPAVAEDPSLRDLPPEHASTEELLAGLDDEETLARQAAERVPPAEAEEGAPCALEQGPQRLWPAPGMSAVAFDGRWLWVASLAFTERRDEEDVVVVRLRPGRRPRPWVRERIPARAARSTPPALLVAPEGLWLVFLDKQGTVQRALVPAVRPSGGLRWEAVGGGADPRFAPALALAGKERWLAWTQGAGQPHGVRLVRFGPDGAQRATHLLHAEAGGGALPRWDRRGERAALYFVDPRRSLSVLWQAELGQDGALGPTSLVRPLQHLYEPPALAVASGLLAYRAMALDARTALVALDLRAPSDRPLVRIVPAEGYAKLRLAATALGPEAALFAVEEPRSPAPRAPRHLAVRLLRRGAEGPPRPAPALRLHGPDGRLEGPALATLDAARGRVAVVAGGPSAVTLYTVRCTLEAAAGDEAAD